MGTAVPDEAGQEPDDCGQAYANQQRVLEGVQHCSEDRKGTVSAGLEGRGHWLTPWSHFAPHLLQ